MPSRGPDPARDGVAHLRRSDPVLARIIDRVGPFGLVARRHADHFGSLARAIVFQQLSGKAAETIHARFLALFDGPPTPASLLGAGEARLRSAGLSRPKVAALVDLATATSDGRLALPLPRALRDEEVVERLTAVRGIGPWTAHMFLMFHLGRPDVLPVGDLGFRTAVRGAYGLRRDPPAETLVRLAEPWRPWRSVATWYLWRSLEGGTSTNPAAARPKTSRATGAATGGGSRPSRAPTRGDSAGRRPSRSR